MRNEKINLALLLLFSIILSLYLFFRTYVISLDGAFQYIPIAKDFASGLFKKGFSHNQQPLYPFLIAFIFQWASDFELAGKWVSTLFGILLIFPAYFLGRQIFDQRIAFLSTLLLLVHPYIRRFSADVLKESTYLFFLVAGLWFAWETIEKGRKFPFFFIPLYSAIAYLARPDGIEVVLVVFFYVLFMRQVNGAKNKWTIILLMVLSSLLFFLPYLIYLRETTGVWTLSRAKTMAWFLGLGITGGETPFIDKLLFSFRRLNLEIFFIVHPLYIFLAVVGLVKRSSPHFRKGEGFLLSFCILHYAVLFLFLLNITVWVRKGAIQADYFSGRYVLPLLLFSVYWVGQGILVIHNWIDEKTGTLRLFLRSQTGNRSLIVWGILFFIVAAIVLPKTFKPQRYDRLPEKWAGVWMRNQFGKGITIFTTVPRVVYYANGDGEYIDLNKDSFDRIMASMVERNALYLAIEEREIIDFPKNGEAIKRDFVELARFEGKGMEKIIVYKRIQ
jgi:hypothetical protein